MVKKKKKKKQGGEKLHATAYFAVSGCHTTNPTMANWELNFPKYWQAGLVL